MGRTPDDRDGPPDPSELDAKASPRSGEPGRHRRGADSSKLSRSAFSVLTIGLILGLIVVAGLFAISGVNTVSRWIAELGAIGDDRPPSDDPTEYVFLVRPGASANEVGAELQRAGFIRSATAFRIQVELRNAAASLAVGEYELRRNMSVGEIVETLALGQTRRTGLVTIPEGWRTEEIARYLEASGVVSAEDFMTVVVGRGGPDAPDLPSGAPSFEGYLFPESYEFGRDVSAETVLRRFLAEFERRVDQQIRTAAVARGLSLHELITLASIVEREASQPDERGEIAAVYENRLDRGMLLQADPTTQYALVPFGTISADTPYWKRELALEDLQRDSPYNTYRTAGLPPGPIANPGIAAINAVANAPERPWLYFVARADGSHLFAESLDAHNQNVARVRAGG